MLAKLFKKESEQKLKKPLTFPILAEGVATGAIVMFNDYFSGVVLYGGLNNTKIGSKHRGEEPVTDTKVWRILDEDEVITLSNKQNNGV